MQPNIKESSKKFKNQVQLFFFKIIDENNLLRLVQLKGRGNITKRMETDVKQRRAVLFFFCCDMGFLVTKWF